MLYDGQCNNTHNRLKIERKHTWCSIPVKVDTLYYKYALILCLIWIYVLVCKGLLVMNHIVKCSMLLFKCLKDIRRYIYMMYNVHVHAQQSNTHSVYLLSIVLPCMLKNLVISIFISNKQLNCLKLK